MSINMLAIFISYTRSFFVIAILLFVVYFLVTGFKNKGYWKYNKKLLLLVELKWFTFYRNLHLLPASKNYFLDRFKELDSNSSDSPESNTLI